MRRLQLNAAAMAVALLVVPIWYAHAASTSEPQRAPTEIEYTVQRGDTLISITQQLLKPRMDWRDLGAVNNVGHPRAIKPGSKLRIPVAWLVPRSLSATVDSVSGPVTVNGKPASKQTQIRESDTIETGNSGVVVVLLPDGTEMNIAPSSQVRVDRLRRYFDEHVIDARIKLNKGQIESSTPVPPAGGKVVGGGRRDIRIQTPKATAAVRGTKFTVAEGERASSSVFVGDVVWQGAGAGRGLTAGLGSSADASGQTTKPEQLLPAPQWQVPTEPLQQTSAQFAFAPVPGAEKYRIRIAGTSNFSSDLTESIVTEPKLQVVSERDGNHFVSVQAISVNGVQGLDAVAKVTFMARPFPPRLQEPADKSEHFGERTRLQWEPADNVTGYRLQIAADSQFNNLLVDTRVAAPSFDYQAPPTAGKPGQRFWRIAALDGWTAGPFTDARQFTQIRKGPVPNIKTTPDESSVSWAQEAGASYVVLITPLTAGASPKRELLVTDKPSVVINDLLPGDYEITVATRTDGYTSAPSPTQSFTVPRLLLDGSGQRVRSADGPVEVSP